MAVLDDIKSTALQLAGSGLTDEQQAILNLLCGIFNACFFHIFRMVLVGGKQIGHLLWKRSSGKRNGVANHFCAGDWHYACFDRNRDAFFAGLLQKSVKYIIIKE